MTEEPLTWQDFEYMARISRAILPFTLIYALINVNVITFDSSFVITHTALGVTIAMVIFCECMKKLSINWQQLWKITFEEVK